MLLSLYRARDPSLPVAIRREAFGRLVDAYQDAAFGAAYAVLGHRQLAEDAALEGFLEAWRHIDSLVSTAAFWNWLRRLVISKASRRLRELRNCPQTNDALVELSTDDSHARLWLDPFLADLPRVQREALILFHVVGLSREETAVFTGVSLTTTKKRLSGALNRLRRRMIEMPSEGYNEILPSGDERFRRRALLLSGEFAELLSQRKPILNALDDCVERAGDGPVAHAFEQMKAQVMIGAPMADAMRRFPQVFRPEDAEAVYVGEEMGLLHDVLARLATGAAMDPLQLRAEYEERLIG